MKTKDLFAQKKLVLSCEVFPPKKSGTLETVIRALKEIALVQPDFVSITCGAGGNGGGNTADVASIACDAFGLSTVAHMTCVGLSKEKLHDELQMLKNKGIENVLCLRGDLSDTSTFYDFTHANELAAYIATHYPEFNLIGACYPEGHPEAESLDKDIDFVRRKVDSGISHLITQMFFDNDAFFRFRDRLAAAGVTVPLQAGIMPVLGLGSVQRIVKMCGVSMPAKFTRILSRYDGDALSSAGINYAAGQMIDLIANEVRGIHLYSMNRGEVARGIFDTLHSIRNALNAAEQAKAIG